MCGIAGIIYYGSDGTVDAGQLERLRDAQRHRGPDDAGLWISNDRKVGLAHRRLSIIDLSPRGHQPMATPDGRLTITFNGEIYNHLELRADLEARGVEFVSDSDTEVILLGFREWGAGIVDRLRGMFAFAIWDDRKREVFLARDPLGIKPLYLAEKDGWIAFSSEMRALSESFDLGEINVSALTGYLFWGSIASPETLYNGARSLEPGSWLCISADGKRDEKTYWRLEDAFIGSEEMDEVEAYARVADALRDSVQHHLIADVPVGAFLSGGVDSVSLVGLLSDAHGGPIETVTLACEDPNLDESKLAAQAARLYGTQHHEIRLDIDEIRDRLPQAIDAMDQPTIDGINTFLVSEAAARAGLKVAVSGVGGDEFFGGYDTFQQIPRMTSIHRRLRWLPGGGALAAVAGRLAERPGSPRAAAKIGRALLHGGSTEGAYYANRGLFSPREVQALLHPDLRSRISASDPTESLARRLDLDAIPADDHVSALEIGQYLRVQLLRDTDAASMAHSLEVRTPLVDRDLLTAVARVPTQYRHAGRAKRALRQAPQKPVPPEIWDRKKQGFTIPFDLWMRSGRLDLPLPTHPFLDPHGVREVAARYKAGNLHWSRLWALMVLGQFLEGA